MADVLKVADAPVETLEQADPLTAIREGVAAKLLADPAFSARVGTRLFHLIRQADPSFDSVTFSDVGVQEYAAQLPAAPVVTDRIFTFDVAARSARLAESIAHSIRRALHQGPVAVPGNVARVAYIGYLDDSGDPAQEGDPARKVIRFRLKAYLRI